MWSTWLCSDMLTMKQVHNNPHTHTHTHTHTHPHTHTTTTTTTTTQPRPQKHRSREGKETGREEKEKHQRCGHAARPPEIMSTTSKEGFTRNQPFPCRGSLRCWRYVAPLRNGLTAEFWRTRNVCSTWGCKKALEPKRVVCHPSSRK